MSHSKKPVTANTPGLPAKISLHVLLDRSEGPLRALMDQLAQREGLDHTLRSALPASIAQQTGLGAWTGKQLELVVADAATATRLRYLVPELLLALQQAGYQQISDLRIRLRKR